MMIRTFLIVALALKLPLSALLPIGESKTLPLSANEGLITGTIEGVCAISGIWVDNEVDIVVPGPEPLVLERHYQSNLVWGWGDNFEASLSLFGDCTNKNVHRLCGLFHDTTGSSIYFSSPLKDLREAAKKDRLLTLDLNQDCKGLTNCGRGALSGRTHPKNTKIYYNPRNEKSMKAYFANGDTCLFKETDFGKFFVSDLTRASGNHILYEHKGGFATKVTTTSASGAPFANLVLNHLNNEQFWKNPRLDITASDGRQLTYTYQLFRDKRYPQFFSYIKEVYRPNAPKLSYDYKQLPNSNVALVSKKNWPDERYLGIEYYNPSDIPVLNNEGHYPRVKLLTAPVGVDGTPIAIQSFNYYITKELTFTDAFNVNGCRTRLIYNKDNRLARIQKFNRSDRLYSQEQALWGAGENTTNLVGRTFEDEHGNILTQTAYHYDSKGNVLEEKLIGNLSGTQDGECYIKTSTYIQDDRNLLSTQTDGTVLERYGYLDNTDLLWIKLICEGLDIKQREYYEYDTQLTSVIVKIIRDDANRSIEKNDLRGMTERHITVIHPKRSAPGIGLPEIVEERYLEEGQEKLLKYAVNTYTREGWLEKQDHYDSERNFCYTLTWQYDNLGNVIQETDPLGFTTCRRYDPNGNLTWEQGPRGNQKQYSYDRANRLIKEEVFTEDEVLVTTHRYDTASNRVATVDPYGQETRYVYDDFNRLIRTELPQSITISQSHDLFGNATQTIDPLGNTTHTSYNIRGQPTKISSPDGTYEQNTYYPNGTLKSQRAKNGTLTHYTYDYLKRPIRQDTYSDGTLLKTTTQVYNSFHLLQTTDPMGNVTNYQYDSAGRLIQETTNSKTITYHYDIRGRKSQVIQEGTILSYEYDNKNQILEERLEDAQNIIRRTYNSYDPAGNLIRTTQGNTTIQTTYNLQNQPTSITDALNNDTYISYNHHHINPQGERVFQKKQTDPLGNTTLITHDIYGRVATLEKTNPFGTTLAKKEHHYNALSQLIRTEDILEDKTITTLFEYSTTGQLLHLTEASETPEQKHTHFRYNTLGQKETTIKPDGIELNYTYDLLNRLYQITSSDNTIAYRYTYNLNDQPLLIEDLILNTTTQKTYDNQGQVIQETLAHGHTLSSTYDNKGRPLTLTLPDETTITYHYDPFYLREVSYQDLTHRYLNYDENGNITHVELIGQAGEIHTTYDPLNHTTEIQAPHYQLKNHYDPVGNLLQSSENTYTYDDLYQLKTEQGTHNHQYQHDSLNNRLSKDGNPYTLNSLNQLISQGNSHYTYDPNGNLIQADERTYTYDALDRLITVTQENLKIHYTYDAFNRRLTKKVQECLYNNLSDYFYGITTWCTTSDIKYLYQGQQEIGSYINGTLQELRILGLGKGAEIGAAIALYLKGDWYAPIHDHNGNVTTLLSLTSESIESYHYSAFGEEDSHSTLNPWRFSSKRMDPHTHLIAFGRRDYDPKLGRWTTPDPQGFADGPNLYAYVHNNPLTHIDLFGLATAGRENWVRRGDNWVHRDRQQRSYRNQRFNPFRHIGKVFSAARHAPFPGLNRLFDIAGRFFNGEGISYRSADNVHSNIDHTVGTNTDSEIGLSISTGQATGIQAALEQAETTSEKFQNTQIRLMYNGTDFFGVDCIHTALIKAGVPTTRVENCVKDLKEKIHNQKLEGKYIQVLVAWSGGASVVKSAISKLNSEEKSQLYVITLGGSSMIFDKQLAGFSNIVDICDFIPFLSDPFGCAYGFFTGQVTFVNSHRIFGQGHEFNNPAYQHTLKGKASDILRNYGGRN